MRSESDAGMQRQRATPAEAETARTRGGFPCYVTEVSQPARVGIWLGGAWRGSGPQGFVAFSCYQRGNRAQAF